MQQGRRKARKRTIKNTIKNVTNNKNKTKLIRTIVLISLVLFILFAALFIIFFYSSISGFPPALLHTFIKMLNFLYFIIIFTFYLVSLTADFGTGTLNLKQGLQVGFFPPAPLFLVILSFETRSYSTSYQIAHHSSAFISLLQYYCYSTYDLH